jgi:hypothetical protein
MNKEKYNQIIDEVYNNYLNEWTFEKHPNDGSVYSIEPIKVKVHSKEQFVYRCKTDSEFSEKWGLKIEERELSYEERIKLYEEKTNLSTTYILSVKETLDKHNIPTKLITLTYNNETIESYE